MTVSEIISLYPIQVNTMETKRTLYEYTTEEILSNFNSENENRKEEQEGKKEGEGQEEKEKIIE